MADSRGKKTAGGDSMNALKEFLIACGLSMYAMALIILVLQFFGAAK